MKAAHTYTQAEIVKTYEHTQLQVIFYPEHNLLIAEAMLDPNQTDPAQG